MPGFLGNFSRIGVKNNFDENHNHSLICESISTNCLYLERRTVDKFLNDKLFHEDEDMIILTEGVILNRLQLIEKFSQINFFLTIKEMFNKLGENSFNELRGSFSGLIFIKKQEELFIFTNQIGDKQIFYYHDNNRFVFGSEMNYLLSFFNKSNIDYSLDISAVYMLITYGFMLEDYTLLNEVKKLNAGEYIKLSRNRLEVRDYFRLNNTQEIDSSEDEIIESIDSLFRNAVKLQFEKDREYGYKHLTSLSGGLDSRMTTWVAHQMGYRQVNYTFSQSNYLDEIIAKKIARDLKNEWIFKFLDNGTFLFDFCKIANLNFGLANFVGTSHGKSMIDLLNLSEFGIIHTGALGDVVLGTYFSDKNRRNFKHGDGGNSNKFLEKLSHKDLKKKYDNEEIFKFYNRGFNGILLSNLAFQLKTESISPFLDVDLINYCMRLPLEFRLNHNIYFKWIKKKYPGATKYIWERTNTKITARRIRIFGRVIPVKLLPKKLFLFALKLIYNKPLISKKNMNPFEYWVKDNKDLSNWIDNSFKSKINCIDYLPELKKDLSELFSKGNVIEKLSVISFLCTHEYYFSS